MAIHPTAIIDPRAEIHETADVGAFCVINGDVRVGPRCRLFHNVYLTGWTQIGEDCVLHPGVIIGHEPQDVKYGGWRSFCRVGRGTVCREHVTIHRGTEPESTTVVGENCFLLGGAHVAHNCVLGNHVTLINNVLLAGHVHVGDRVTMGGAAVVHQFVRIGELAMIAGNGRVPLDVLPFAMLDVEGRIAGLNRVGFRRAGFTREQQVEVREIYRVLFNQGLGISEAVSQLADRDLSAAGRKIIEFLAAPSKRGMAGRSKRAGRPVEQESADR